MKTFLESPWGVVRADEHKRVMVVERSEVPARTAADMGGMIQELAERLDTGWSDWGLVIDMRKVRGNNDPEVESAGQDTFGALRRRFARSVVLVRSMAGVLQIQRLARSRGVDEDLARVTTDESLAFA